MSDQVLHIEYFNRGRPTARPYRHNFDAPGVEMWGLADGSVLIRHPQFPVWDLFDLEEGET